MECRTLISLMRSQAVEKGSLERRTMLAAFPFSRYSLSCSSNPLQAALHVHMLTTVSVDTSFHWIYLPTPSGNVPVLPQREFDCFSDMIGTWQRRNTMRRKLRNFTWEEKMRVLRGHLINQIPLSDLCDELGLQPTVLYRSKSPPQIAKMTTGSHVRTAGITPRSVRHNWD